MYLPSDSNLLAGQRQSAALQGACSRARIADMRNTAAAGRARAFDTIVQPSDVLSNMGVPAAVNTQKLQNQTAVSRASGLAGNGNQVDAGAHPSVHQIISDAPEVVSLNRGGTCQTTGKFQRVPLPADSQPGMPQRAPAIVNTSSGPMYFRGAASTIPSDTQNQNVPFKIYQSPLTQPTNYTAPSVPTVYAQILPAAGMSGVAAPWGDAWTVPDPNAPADLISWFGEHPWLVLALVAGGAYVLSQRGKR